MWPWKTKKGRTVKGRTVESYDKRGRLRVLCIAGGSPVIGEITIRTLEGSPRLGWEPRKFTSRRTRCPECGFEIGVTGPKTDPRLYVHNGDYTR